MTICKSLGLTILVILTIWQHQASCDTVIIEKIECRRVATGIDNAARVLAAAIGGTLAGLATAGAGVVTTGPAAPVTAPAVASAAAGGASGAVEALEFFNKQTKGIDQLIVNINGEKVFPKGGKYYNIKSGQSIRPNIRFDCNGNARIQFLEYDWGSDNDNLGSLDINARSNAGKNWEHRQAILFSEEEGSTYYVDYRVERNKRGFGEKWMMCGTAACKSCGEEMCRRTSNSGLDRDGDKGDLRKCPTGFRERGFKKYPQMWPFDDVFLRICSTIAVNNGGGATLKNLGKECWNKANCRDGPCPNFCGTFGYCCRKGWRRNGCDGIIGGAHHHRCAKKPVDNYGRNYRFVTTRKTHADAERHCRGIGLKLVSIDSASENRYLQKKGGQMGSHSWWIGGRRSYGNSWRWGPGEKSWSASNKSDKMFRNWYRGEPNNWARRENCVEIYTFNGNHNGKWNDDDCSKRMSFICEVKGH